MRPVDAAAAQPAARWPDEPGRDAAALVVALPAIVLPLLLAWNVSPSSTFLNQAAAVVGWGGWAVWWTWRRPAARFGAGPPGDRPGAWALALAVALLIASTLGSALLTDLPPSLAWSTAGMLAAALLVAGVGWAVARAGGLPTALRGACLAMVLAGVLSAVVGWLQVYGGAVDGAWIAATSLPGRAAGNLRQPNHLSSVMLLALVALAATGVRGWLPGPLRWILLPAFAFVLVLTGSRTGTLGAVMLGVWGAADRTLAPSLRRWLIAVPLCYLLWWAVIVGWPSGGGEANAMAERFTTHGDVSSSRFSIWRDTWQLIAAHPWWGVGVGEFNFAWSLTPFPHRPVAFFDHTHNIVLQFVVEMGWPLGLSVTGLLAFACWRALRAAARADEADRGLVRCAFMAVAVIALHSLLEYPLWYAYFLLPTACFLGLCLGVPASASASAAASGTGVAAEADVARPAPASAAPISWQALRIAAALMVALGVYSVIDYWKVVVIFSPPTDAGPLAQRIEAGKRSLFFAHHAHYAAATSSPRPSEEMTSFRAASHFLLDTRLMTAWAKAYHELGDDERARHLAERLREFQNPGSKAYVEDECVAAGVPWARLFPVPAARAGLPPAPPVSASAPAAVLPYQCSPPSRRLDYRDFR